MIETNWNFDDATLKRALEDAEIPTLMMVTYHLSGDDSVLEGDELPSPWPTDGLKGMSAETQANIRRRAFEVLRACRDEKRAVPPIPTAQTLQRMMSVAAGEPMAPEYVPMMLEEMRFDEVASPKTSHSRQVRTTQKKDFSVVIIGAGLSGICMAMKLEELGIEYTILDRHEAFGGIWHENTYPGCAVDTPNHLYSFTNEPNHKWSRYFASQQEVKAYFQECARKHGIDKKTSFNTEVLSATYESGTGKWNILCRNGDGNTRQLSAQVLISAVGHLNQPKFPSIPGLDSFEGASFHSARWDHEAELRGKNIALIGAGASANQIARHMAKIAGKLTIYQRSAHWIGTLRDYQGEVSPQKMWLLEHIPYYANWYRFRLFWGFCDALYPQVFIDPERKDLSRAVNKANERMRDLLEHRIRRELADRPDLIEKAIPTFPVFGKRMIADNDWYKTLLLPNVELVTDSIDHIEKDRIVTAGSVEHPTDVMILATGFYPHRYMWPMEVIGKSGTRLWDAWKDDPRAYLGITVPDYPNFFCIYGPNAALAHGGSTIFLTECQVRYIGQCVDRLRTDELRSIDCKPVAYQKYSRALDERLARTVWAMPDFSNTFKNQHGRVVSNLPWRLIEYWKMTYEPNWDDYVLEA